MTVAPHPVVTFAVLVLELAPVEVQGPLFKAANGFADPSFVKVFD
jgi:hypothetical protein